MVCIKLEVAGSVPVVVNSVYSANNENAGKIAGSEQRSVVDAGIYSHSGGAGAVPVMNFGKSCKSTSHLEWAAFQICTPPGLVHCHV